MSVVVGYFIGLLFGFMLCAVITGGRDDWNRSKKDKGGISTLFASNTKRLMA